MNRKSLLALAIVVAIGYAITRMPKSLSAPPAPQVVTISSGSAIAIRLKQPLGSAINVSGQSCSQRNTSYGSSAFLTGIPSGRK